jgi:hypothetical protein
VAVLRVVAAVAVPRVPVVSLVAGRAVRQELALGRGRAEEELAGRAARCSFS